MYLVLIMTFKKLANLAKLIIYFFKWDLLQPSFNNRYSRHRVTRKDRKKDKKKKEEKDIGKLSKKNTKIKFIY